MWGEEYEQAQAGVLVTWCRLCHCGEGYTPTGLVECSAPSPTHGPQVPLTTCLQIPFHQSSQLVSSHALVLKGDHIFIMSYIF